MPIYEYSCEKCGSNFEKLVFAGDKEKITCPCCNSDQVKKMVSCVSFMGGSSIGKCSTSAPSGFS